MQLIIFNDYYDAKAARRPNDPVVVLDAVNAGTNVACKWDESIKQAQGHERNGRKEAALDTWRQVFGDDFRRLSQ